MRRFLLAAFLVAAPLVPLNPVALDRAAAQPAAIGGPFRLTDQEGKPFGSDELKGRPFALFFGFTHCPDVCPTTLFQLSEDLKALGVEGERLQAVFVSVDPERDRPEDLAVYLQSFDPRIKGLTGTPAEVDAAAKAYKATYKKVPLTGDSYTIDHTAVVYLMDATGRFFSALNAQEPPETRRAKLLRLAREG
ncbi:MAG TPA: SCO family protein [Beijerinckiaceae bacterium]|jgi:protein SCO1/2